LGAENTLQQVRPVGDLKGLVAGGKDADGNAKAFAWQDKGFYLGSPEIDSEEITYVYTTVSVNAGDILEFDWEGYDTDGGSNLGTEDYQNNVWYKVGGFGSREDYEGIITTPNSRETRKYVFATTGVYTVSWGYRRYTPDWQVENGLKLYNVKVYSEGAPKLTVRFDALANWDTGGKDARGMDDTYVGWAREVEDFATLRAPEIGPGGITYVYTTVTVDSGDSIQFEWSPSCDAAADHLWFNVGAVGNPETAFVEKTSGEADYSPVSYEFTTAGTYALYWAYSRDIDSPGAGENTGRIRNINIMTSGDEVKADMTPRVNVNAFNVNEFKGGMATGTTGPVLEPADNWFLEYGTAMAGLVSGSEISYMYTTVNVQAGDTLSFRWKKGPAYTDAGWDGSDGDERLWNRYMCFNVDSIGDKDNCVSAVNRTQDWVTVEYTGVTAA
jgi:plastocyanin